MIKSFVKQSFLKHLIWLYLFLLIFEGVFRKWIMPGLSNELLLIRDPLVVLIYLVAFIKNRFPINLFFVFAVIISIFAFFLSMTAGHEDFLITMYGIRTNFLHVPLIFVMYRALDYDDVIRLGKFILFVSIPMAILMVLQFFTSRYGYLNRGPGFQVTAMPGMGGHVRPSGTFPFLSGPAAFFPIVMAYVLAFQIEKIKVSKVLLILSGLSLIVILPFSISRLLVLSCVIAFIGAFIGLCFKRKTSLALGRVVFLVCCIAMILPFVSFYNEGVSVFTARWEHSTGDSVSSLKRTILDRFIYQFTGPFDRLFDTPLGGYGIGLGTNVGSKYLTGVTSFKLGEGEWQRIIGELGPILGIAYILYRIMLVLYIFIMVYRASIRYRIVLPMALFFTSFLLLLSGQWGPPTILGFAIFGGGLTLASAKLQSHGT